MLRANTKSGYNRFYRGKLNYHTTPPITREVVDKLPDPDDLFLDILKQRVKENKRVGSVTIYKTIEGKTYSFTQNQVQSVSIYMRQVDG